MEMEGKIQSSIHLKCNWAVISGMKTDNLIKIKNNNNNPLSFF